MQSQGHGDSRQREFSPDPSVFVQSCGVNRVGLGALGDIAATLGGAFNQNHGNLT